MGIIEGLDEILAYREAEDAKYSNTDYVKTDWFSLKDKGSAAVQFLQALSKSDPGYSEKNGLGVMAVEHNHPNASCWTGERTLQGSLVSLTVA